MDHQNQNIKRTFFSLYVAGAMAANRGLASPILSAFHMYNIPFIELFVSHNSNWNLCDIVITTHTAITLHALNNCLASVQIYLYSHGRTTRQNAISQIIANAVPGNSFYQDQTSVLMGFHAGFVRDYCRMALDHMPDLDLLPQSASPQIVVAWYNQRLRNETRRHMWIINMPEYVWCQLNKLFESYDANGIVYRNNLVVDDKFCPIQHRNVILSDENPQSVDFMLNRPPEILIIYSQTNLPPTTNFVILHYGQLSQKEWPALGSQ